MTMVGFSRSAAKAARAAAIWSKSWPSISSTRQRKACHLSRSGRDVLDVADPAVDLQVVVVQEDAEVGQLAEAGGHGRFPDLALLGFAVADQGEDARRARREAQAHGHAGGHGQPLAQGAGGGLHPGGVQPVRVALQAGSGLAQAVEELRREKSALGQGGVEHRARRAPWKGRSGRGRGGRGRAGRCSFRGNTGRSGSPPPTSEPPGWPEAARLIMRMIMIRIWRAISIRSAHSRSFISGLPGGDQDYSSTSSTIFLKRIRPQLSQISTSLEMIISLRTWGRILMLQTPQKSVCT